MNKVLKWSLGTIAALYLLAALSHQSDLKNLEKTPEGRAKLAQKAEEKKAKAAQREIDDQLRAKQKLIDDANHMRLWNVKQLIKDNANNPESIEFRKEYVDENVVCLEFTGMNGFGGIVRERIVYYKNTLTKSAKAFRKHCE